MPTNTTQPPAPIFATPCRLLEPLDRCPQIKAGSTLYAIEFEPKRWHLWLARTVFHARTPGKGQVVSHYEITGGVVVNVDEKKLAQVGEPVELRVP